MNRKLVCLILLLLSHYSIEYEILEMVDVINFDGKCEPRLFHTADIPYLASALIPDKCLLATCTKHVIRYKGCPSVDVSKITPGCIFERADTTLLYPDCCPHAQCFMDGKIEAKYTLSNI